MASPVEHAHLSASSSARWLTCTPSAKFGLEFPDSGETSEFAKEGTAAHAMAEIKLKYDTGKITKSTVGKYIRKFRRENEYWSMGFEEHVDDYVGYVNEVIAEYDSPEVVLEQRVDFSEWVPDGFGTSDVVIMAEPVLHIVDLKFGKGVPVSAIENTQLMLYALGTFSEFSLAYDFDTIRMTIHQPRLHDVSTYEIPIKDLLDWANNYVKPRAEMAMAGEGEFNPSEKACRFCPAKAVCKARADKNIEEFKEELGDDPRRLKPEDISSILERAGEVKKWLGDVEDYALTCHPIDYDPEAECPTFDGYLREVVGEEEAQVIYEWMGYLFYGDYRLQKMLFIYGGGGTGKSTILNLMQELVGKGAISAITLEAMLKEPHAMAGLVSKTANFDADAKPEFLKDGALLKKLTGDDMSYANPKNRDAFYFRNKAKLTFSMNTLPPMSDHSGGLARRAMIIKMDKRVTDKVMTEFPLKQMKQEMTGIFNKAMEALRAALKRGDFTDTEGMKTELAKWLEGNDTVALFIKDGCIQEEGKYEITSTLYRDYSIYARESGFKPTSKLRFYNRVIDLGFEKKTKKQGSTTVQAFMGLQSTGTEF